ncbi:MAG: DNA cytosine methyltransferase [Azospirillum brasilense]|nr:MAG: DNA cytosine methyltransferase [Azospirillum brasilense]
MPVNWYIPVLLQFRRPVARAPAGSLDLHVLHRVAGLEAQEARQVGEAADGVAHRVALVAPHQVDEGRKIQRPLPDWREATTADIHAAAGHERPHIVFLSAPCKGFSGLLSESKSQSAKYQALNRLTLRGIWLTLEAFASDLPELMIFENVPRIQTRGRQLLDRICGLLRSYGYEMAETTHDCGRLGGLAQSRKRFLLVARHREKVPPFLYEPPNRPLRSVGDVLGRMPLPGSGLGGPMHRIPSLRWQTWVRLAFVEAGSDWRSLAKLAIEDGHLRDFALVPDDWRASVLGVRPWDEPCGTVAGRSSPTNGAYSVADPRFFSSEKWKDGQQYGVKGWGDTAHCIAGSQAPGQGAYAVADPRDGGEDKFNNCYRVVRLRDVSPTVTGDTGPSAGGLAVADPRPTSAYGGHGKYRITTWGDQAGTVISASGTGNGAFAVADPRPEERRSGALGVIPWTKRAGTVAGESLPSNGAFAVADPRPGMERAPGDNYYGAGHYGVVPWDAPTGAVSSAAGYDNGRWSVADPRLPDATNRVVARIRSLDGTWHRPFSTLELAALQSLVEPEEHLELDGLSDADWRERIGNAVPPDAAAAIASTMGTTLLLAWSGESFMLSNTPIWVRNVAVALSVKSPDWSGGEGAAG